MVYDITNNEISIAPTNFNALDSNIVEIGTSNESNIFNLPGTAKTTTTTQPSSAATSSPASSATEAGTDDTSFAMHYSWSTFATLGGVLAAFASIASLVAQLNMTLTICYSLSFCISCIAGGAPCHRGPSTQRHTAVIGIELQSKYIKSISGHSGEVASLDGYGGREEGNYF